MSEMEDIGSRLDAIRAARRHLNQPMLNRLRKCAADTSPNWDGRITIYPNEARQLIALADAADALPDPAEEGGR